MADQRIKVGILVLACLVCLLALIAFNTSVASADCGKKECSSAYGEAQRNAERNQSFEKRKKWEDDTYRRTPREKAVRYIVDSVVKKKTNLGDIPLIGEVVKIVVPTVKGVVKKIKGGNHECSGSGGMDGG